MKLFRSTVSLPMGAMLAFFLFGSLWIVLAVMCAIPVGVAVSRGWEFTPCLWTRSVQGWYWYVIVGVCFFGISALFSTSSGISDLSWSLFLGCFFLAFTCIGLGVFLGAVKWARGPLRVIRNT